MVTAKRYGAVDDVYLLDQLDIATTIHCCPLHPPQADDCGGGLENQSQCHI